ncbi:tyrosine-protein phosphatase [Pseudozobellia sp. WGM2]|uniref:tyrosine-protein phosphatase n=1 Tax=Pseudozobellia sp. WGM2 TaxID=2787625 RepID=UPI001AE0E370|nr:CpsB/CapC family capsule biosynthesis tyrosine phosphatase [Pseudozobellia sp. WGM2]
MFNFFSKKKFLVDYLDGFVDIHNHILPGIDDGSKSVEESIALIKGFKEFGVNRFVATPHIMNNYYPNTGSTINDSLNKLRNSLKEADLHNVHIEASAEHMIDDNFENLLDNDSVMPMKDNYLLIEMSYLQPPINFDEALVKTVEKHFFPILAHPERYGFLHFRKRRYSEYKEQGIMFQMNLLSLGDYYGKDVTKVAHELLDQGQIDFIGSDVHNINQLSSLKNLTISEKTAEKLLPIINNTIANFY